MTVLSRYWDLFLSTWNVMLHGNPIRGVLGGINVATSGELGIGVGEEDRGSAEREVLEGLVDRIEGLLDVVVSKFGDEESDEETKSSARHDPQQWLGTGQEPHAHDGAVFLGTGALSRKSLRDVTHWMEDLYTWGEHAYGVIESPTSTRRRKGSRLFNKPEPAVEPESQKPANSSKGHTLEHSDEAGKADPEEGENGKSLDKMVSYLKLGYGTYWSFPGGQADSENETSQPVPGPSSAETSKNTKGLETRPGMISRSSSHDSNAHYLIGLTGDIEDSNSENDETQDSDNLDAEYNSRTVVRTVNIELESEGANRPEAMIVRDFQHPGSLLTQSQVVGNMLPGYDSHNLNKARKLRVVVYVNRPFIFTLFFELRTDSLAWESLYRSLHDQLAPLKKPLIAATKYRPERPASGPATTSIYDLVWDPQALTVHCNIPNIPEHYTPTDSWTRADALSTHLHLLNIHGASRGREMELERTQKTTRGWWIVWTRLMERSQRDASPALPTIRETAPSETDSRPGTVVDDDDEPNVEKEIFLIRRASDHARFRSEGVAEGAGKLVQGIGVDTRRYVEELLNLL